MLLNLPLDLWETAHVNAVISKWGKLLSCIKLSATSQELFVKVRVEAPADNPFSLQFSHGNDFNAESWTVPIYILSQRLMGMEAQDPSDDGETPHPLPALPFHEDHGHHNIPDLNENVVVWQPWPAPPEDVQQNLPEDPPLAT